jgi:hypothetical protein
MQHREKLTMAGPALAIICMPMHGTIEKQRGGIESPPNIGSLTPYLIHTISRGSRIASRAVLEQLRGGIEIPG